MLRPREDYGFLRARLPVDTMVAVATGIVVSVGNNDFLHLPESVVCHMCHSKIFLPR